MNSSQDPELSAAAASGTCGGDGCDEETPFDMPGILIDSEGYCSASCARVEVRTRKDAPESISLWDPQHLVSRDAVSGDQGSPRLVRTVSTIEGAIEAITEAERLYPGSLNRI